MKTYGVNWFLVWMGWLLFSSPFCAWLQELLHFHTGSAVPSRPPAWAFALIQAFSLSWGYTWLYHFAYGKTLDDPKAIERLRQSRQRSEATYRRYRWLALWSIMFAVVGVVSAAWRLILERPSWLHVVGYSLLLPCSFLVCSWLINRAGEKGQLAQLLKDSTV